MTTIAANNRAITPAITARADPATRTYNATVQVRITGATISAGARNGAVYAPDRAALTTSAELPCISDEGVYSMAAGDVRLADGQGHFSLRKICPQRFNVTIPLLPRGGVSSSIEIWYNAGF